MMCADLVDVRWTDRSGRSRGAVANLEDISRSGVCLHMDGEIPLTTVVRITYPKGEFLGVVQYCQFKEIGYYVGVRFEDGTKWSEINFTPMHLFDPREMVEQAGMRDKEGA